MSAPRMRLSAVAFVTAALIIISYLFQQRSPAPLHPADLAHSIAKSPTTSSPTTSATTGAQAAAAAVRRETLERLAYSQSWHRPLPPAMAAFRAWTKRYVAAGVPRRAQLESEGVTLARARRAEMRRMIVIDPQRALAVTIPAALRRSLPPAVLSELETRHAGRGEFSWLASQPKSGAPRAAPALHRIIYLDGITYTARPYGRREAQLTKEGASLHGIALDGEFAVHESPLRVLDPAEIPPETAASACAGCAAMMEPVEPGLGVNLTALEFVEADGRWWRLHEAELESFEQRALAAEDQSGPRVQPLSQATANAASPPLAAAVASPHTVGTKQVLVIRVDFADFPDEPISQAAARTLLDGGVNSYFEEASYGETTLVATVTPQLYRMHRTGASYATANDTIALHNDARTAAAANFTLANFDRIIVVFPNLGSSRIPESRFMFGGLGAVGGTNIWINGPGAFVLTTVAHELGHTYGLLHGNLWRVTDGNPVSPSGRTLEYGDPFDMMGSTSATGVTRDARHHFNMWGKNHLGWLPDDAVVNVTQSGTYRIYRFDTRDAPRSEPLALRIFRDGVRSYWVGLRQNFSAGTLRADGAYVVWGYNQRLQTQLLDLTTPGDNANDAALGLGSTFTDAEYGVIIKPVARGGAEPLQWLDVEVTIPDNPPNVVTAWGRLGATFYDTETGEDRQPVPETNVPMGLTRVQAIAAGDQHGVALKDDGTVIAWGDHVSGQIAVPPGLTNVASIAAGGDLSGVVLRDGTIRVWGEASAGVTSPPSGLTEVSRLAIGRNHALALKTDGTVVAWGADNQGQSTVPGGLTDVIAVAAGSEFSLVLKRDGTVAAWGLAGVRNTIPAGLSGVTAISAFGGRNGGQFAVALKSDGTVVAWGANNIGQSTVPAGTANIAAIAAGAFHTVLLRQDGTVTTFGSSGNGRAAVPPSLPRAVAVAASSAASFALTGTSFTLSLHPEAQVAAVGASATFRVTASGSEPLSYQWRKDGSAIAGATASTYIIPQVATGDAGNYDVIVTSGGSTLTSAVARLTISPSAPVADVSRIANLSIRTHAGTAAQTLIVGFVVGGQGTAGTKPLLLRGIGPTLNGFGVSGALLDPKMELFNSASARLLENDNWNAADSVVFSSVGAFLLPAGSRDAALYHSTLASGGYSAQLSGVDGTSGIVLAEIYDATTTGTSFSATLPRLVNVSARAFSGTGADVLIAGFTIAGGTSKTVLIRAIGPTLELFGVPDTLSDPKLELYDHVQSKILENDNWGGSATLTAAYDSVGAFRLAPSSQDAALLTTLPAGAYTVQVSGVGNTTGVALVEIYDVP
jgi:hypothetical protein